MSPYTTTTAPDAARTRRTAAVAVLAAAPVLLAVLALTLAGRLAPVVATHWSGSAADGYDARGTFVAQTLVAATVLGVAGLLVALLAREEAARRFGAAAGAGFAWGVVGTAVGVAAASYGVPDAAGARLRPWPFLGLLLGPLAAVVVARLWGRAPRPVEPAVHPLDLSPGERAVWTRRLTSHTLAVASLVMLVVTVLSALLVGDQVPTLTVTLVVATLIVAAVASARVTVDERGLTVGISPANLVVKRVPLQEVSSAESLQVEPLQWGGWGYRIGPGRSALVLREGEGVVVHQRDGRDFAVTVDDSATAAALLNALQLRAG